MTVAQKGSGADRDPEPSRPGFGIEFVEPLASIQMEVACCQGTVLEVFDETGLLGRIEAPRDGRQILSLTTMRPIGSGIQVRLVTSAGGGFRFFQLETQR